MAASVVLRRLRLGGPSLRLRLLAGAGIIAVLAMTAAAPAAWASACVDPARPAACPG